MDNNLLTRTKFLLEQDSRTLLEIHHQSGISHTWLRKFRYGYIKEPSVVKIQQLYEFLSGHKLEV